MIRLAGGEVSYASSYLPEKYLYLVPSAFLVDHVCHISAVHFAGLEIQVKACPRVAQDGETTVIKCEMAERVTLQPVDMSTSVRLLTINGKKHVYWSDSSIDWSDGSMRLSERLDLELVIDPNEACKEVELRVHKSAPAITGPVSPTTSAALPNLPSAVPNEPGDVDGSGVGAMVENWPPADIVATPG
jgi:hypothetical protein